MQPFPNVARLVAPLSDWQLQFRNFMVDVSPRSILALSGPMPWRAGFKTSLTMATRADQHTRQRGRAYKTKWEHSEQRTATKAMSTPAVVRDTPP